MGRHIYDAAETFRSVATAITSTAASDAVRIIGGNLEAPMMAEITYWGALTSSGAGTVVFSITRCATSGGTYTEHVDGTSYTVVTGTTAKRGVFRIPVCHPDDYTKVNVVLTGTGASVSYNAYLVPNC